MIHDPPCSVSFTDSMNQLHQWLMGGVGVTAVMSLGVAVDRLRLLWADYRKKHKINGDGGK